MEYKKANVKWLEKIPSHWKIDRIKDKTTRVVGGDWGNDPESNAQGKNVVVLRVADLDDIYFSYNNLTYRKIKDSSIKSRAVNKNSLLIEKSGGGEKQFVGRVGYPQGMNFMAISSNFMAKIEFDNSVDIRFANYMFSSLYASKLNFPFVQQTTGIQNLNVGYYLTTKVAFPPKKEQTAIANYLDKACAQIDEIIRIKEEQLNVLDDYFISYRHKIITQGINKKDFVSYDDDFLKKVPSDWQFTKLRYLLSLKNGKLIKNSELIKGGKVPVYGGNGIMGRTNKHNYNGESIIIGRVGAKCGNIHYTNEKIWVSDNATAVKTLINYEYTLNLLKVLKLNRFASETAQPLLVGNNIKKIHVAIPSLLEQKDIVKKIKIVSNKIDLLKSKTKSQITILENYRKSLIHECVTGKKQVIYQDV
mgnify:CR=1 FL=1